MAGWLNRFAAGGFKEAQNRVSEKLQRRPLPHDYFKRLVTREARRDTETLDAEAKDFINKAFLDEISLYRLIALYLVSEDVTRKARKVVGQSYPGTGTKLIWNALLDFIRTQHTSGKEIVQSEFQSGCALRTGNSILM